MGYSTCQGKDGIINSILGNMSKEVSRQLLVVCVLSQIWEKGLLALLVLCRIVAVSDSPQATQTGSKVMWSTVYIFNLLYYT